MREEHSNVSAQTGILGWPTESRLICDRSSVRISTRRNQVGHLWKVSNVSLLALRRAVARFLVPRRGFGYTLRTFESTRFISVPIYEGFQPFPYLRLFINREYGQSLPPNLSVPTFYSISFSNSFLLPALLSHCLVLLLLPHFPTISVPSQSTPTRVHLALSL